VERVITTGRHGSLPGFGRASWPQRTERRAGPSRVAREAGIRRSPRLALCIDGIQASKLPPYGAFEKCLACCRNLLWIWKLLHRSTSPNVTGPLSMSFAQKC
jgi:hypothetical protein